MQIKLRLAIQFTIIVCIIICSFAAVIYFLSAKYRKDEFYKRIEQRALTTARLLSTEVQEVDTVILKAIDRNSSLNLPEECIQIFSLENKLLYSACKTNNYSLPASTFNEAIKKKSILMNIKGKEAILFLYESNYDRFVVFASALDVYGISKLAYLRNLLLTGILIAIIITIITGSIFARQALLPIHDVIRQVDRISFSNLFERVNEGNGRDEIALLAIKFNKMLERLDESFAMQRSFVSNASHELRTPLTSLTGQLEIALMDKENSASTKKLLTSLLDDIRDLNKLSNGLLDLAQASLDITSIEVRPLRVDELLGNIQSEIIKINHDYHLYIHFTEIPDEEELLQVNGNEQLLKAALLNVIENACKYSSDHSALIEINPEPSGLSILISDKGIGIPQENINNIFEPFFRCSNANHIPGNGIGLALSLKIISLHSGKISVASELNKGTIVSIFLPCMKIVHTDD